MPKKKEYGIRDEVMFADAAEMQPVTVLVTDAGGNPVSGASVTFRVKSGKGSFDPASATSDAVGEATTQFRAAALDAGETVGTTKIEALSGKSKIYGQTIYLYKQNVPAADAPEGLPFKFTDVIDDSEMTSLPSQLDSTLKIQDFLQAQQSGLASYLQNNRSAAQIIFEAAFDKGINPAVILTTLEKEQGLIHKKLNEPTAEQYQHALNYAMGAAPASNFSAQLTTGAQAYHTSWIKSGEKPMPRRPSEKSTLYISANAEPRLWHLVTNKATWTLFEYNPELRTGPADGGTYSFFYHWCKYRFNAL